MPESKSKRRKGRRRSVRPPSVQTPPKHRRTSRWIIPLVFGLWAVGVLVIILNYMGIFGGTAQNPLLFAGLGLIAVGFVFSTKIY